MRIFFISIRGEVWDLNDGRIESYRGRIGKDFKVAIWAGFLWLNSGKEFEPRNARSSQNEN
jgi:hypothetical protein